MKILYTNLFIITKFNELIYNIIITFSHLPYLCHTDKFQIYFFAFLSEKKNALLLSIVFHWKICECLGCREPEARGALSLKWNGWKCKFRRLYITSCKWSIPLQRNLYLRCNMHFELGFLLPLKESAIGNMKLLYLNNTMINIHILRVARIIQISSLKKWPTNKRLIFWSHSQFL